MKNIHLIFLSLVFPALSYGQGIVKTIAGNGAPGYGSDGIPATQTSLRHYPEKVALGPDGNIYLADSNRIRKIDGTTGIITTIAGADASGSTGDGGLAVNARFNRIIYIAFAPNSDLYLTDAGNNKIRKIDHQSGIVSTVAGTGIYGFAGDGGPAIVAQLAFPYGIAFDRDSNLLIADILNNRIRKVDQNGMITTIAGNGVLASTGDGGPALSAALAYGGGLCVDTANNIYIECFTENRVRKIEATTGIITTYAGTGNGPSGGDGGLAVNANIVGTGDMTIDIYGNIYIAESAAHKIRKVDAVTGIISTVAGTGTAGYNGENIPGDIAMLSEPTFITVDSCQNLYISDAGNFRIRKVTFDHCGELSVNEAEYAEGISIYPVPTTNNITIESNEQMTSISLHDITARSLMERKVNTRKYTLDLSSLSPGVYLLRVNSGSFRKFIRQ